MRVAAHYASICLFALLFGMNPFSTQYVSGSMSESENVIKQKDSLYTKIVDESSEFYIPPQNAVIDRVWKAIPGLNGVEVDVEASYKKMKRMGKYEKSNLVFKPIQPKINLSDLPPSPIYKGHPEKEMVGFIINVAWGNEYLPDILATLKEHHVSASFFLEGRWVQTNPDLAKLIDAAGHEVGNHSYTHPDLARTSVEKTREEIGKTNKVIEAITEKPVQWFAPPSGSYKEETVQIAAQEKLGTVMWTVDTVDWKKPTPEQLLQRVMSKVHNGALILMHPTDSTAKSLDRLIMQIKQKNLQIGTVSDVLNTERTTEKIAN